MSLFGTGMGGFEDDPALGSANRMMRQMDTMMGSMMQGPFGGDPFGGMMGGPMMGMGGMGSMMGAPMRQPQQQQQQQLAVMGNNNMNAMSMMGNPMAMMNTMMSNMDHMRGESSSQVFSSSSVMSMTTGPDGRPQVYQESSVSRGGPGGVRETQRTVSDSRTGTRKMAIGHHIGDRAHIIERERNRDGEEENQEYINLDEEEADEFEQEFRHASGRHHNAIRGGRSGAPATARTQPAIAAAPLAIQDRQAVQPTTDRNDTRPAHLATYEARPTTDTYEARPTTGRYDTTGGTRPSVRVTSDGYPGVERISLNLPTGIDTSNFDRRTGGVERSGLDRLEYHRPNTSYTPTPTSYSRPLGTYSSSSGRGGGEDGVSRAPHSISRANRRPSPYNQ